AGGGGPSAGGAARAAGGGVSCGVYVHGGDASELGQLVSGGGSLPAFFEAWRERKTLRERVALGDAAAGGGGSVGVLGACVDPSGMGICAGGGRGDGQRLSAALVLVADQCVERNR